MGNGFQYVYKFVFFLSFCVATGAKQQLHNITTKRAVYTTGRTTNTWMTDHTNAEKEEQPGNCKWQIDFSKQKPNQSQITWRVSEVEELEHLVKSYI